MNQFWPLQDQVITRCPLMFHNQRVKVLINTNESTVLVRLMYCTTPVQFSVI